MTHTKYRPDIDGLRAISVLSVIAFHGFPQLFPGGFIGVDVFFVISGYLISKILFNELNANSFSFFNFYLRRAKRIFPTLTLVLFFCYFWGWFSLLAPEYRQLGKHLAGGAGFLSNFVNWSEAGYFDVSADFKPLLHLWSLGIEEQFYLLWPVVLWLVWKKPQGPLLSILGLTIFSFVLNLLFYQRDRIGVFFSPQTRIWELLSGSLLAWCEISPTFDGWSKKYRSERLQLFFSVFGFMLLIFSFCKINKDLSYPGKWGILPVLGTILIIFSGPHNWINGKLLSHPALVSIGLISFPLYLWHWPMLSFATIIEDGHPSFRLKSILILLSFIFAWLSYRFIELPIRFGHLTKVSFLKLLLPISLLGLVGLITYFYDGLWFRKNATLVGYLGDTDHRSFHRYVEDKFYPCSPSFLAKEAPKWEGFTRCAQTKRHETIDVALIGDSHAEHLFIGLAEQLKDLNLAFYIQSSPPFISNPEFQNILNFISHSTSIKTVFLTMFWNGRSSQFPKGSSMESELIKTINSLSKSGKTIYLTDDVPEFPFNPNRCKGKRWLTSKPQICTFKSQAMNFNRDYLKIVSLNHPNVHLIQTMKYFCENNICNMTDGDKILFRDSHHLNIEGSLLLGKKMAEDNPAFIRNIMPTM